MVMRRRDLLAGTGALLAALGGCTGWNPMGGSAAKTTEEWIPQLGAVYCMNFHDEPHDVAVTVTVGGEEAYRDQVHLPAADQDDPSEFPATEGISLSTPFEPAPYTVEAEMNGQKDETDGTDFDFAPADWKTYPTTPCAIVAIKIRDSRSIEIDDHPDPDDSLCATGETNGTVESGER